MDSETEAYEFKSHKREVRARPRLTVRARKNLVEISGSRCMLPACGRELAIGENAFIGEVAMIESFSPCSPRYSPSTSTEPLVSQDNLILLCPTCHKLVDRQPGIYTVNWLREAKLKHLEKLKSIISTEQSLPFRLNENTEISLKKALSIWDENRENGSEEFWQELLAKCPSVLSQVFPNSSFQLGAKSYVGGKNLKNKHGNIVDFIYVSKHTDNVVLVEIKTPTKKLLGCKYRGNAYSISDELSGGVVQVLNYKEQLLKEYYKIKDDESSFNAFSPKCLVLIGSIEKEMTSPVKIKSLELFRGSLSGVQIITYDELFEKAKNVLDLVS